MLPVMFSALVCGLLVATVAYSIMSKRKGGA